MELDKADVALLLKDLDRLDKQVTRNSVMRKVLKRAGRPIMRLIKKNNRAAFRGGSRMARTFKFKQNTYKRALVTVWIQSDVSFGDGIGRMTNWFEHGTADRHQTSTGKFTGRVEKGAAKTYIGEIKTEFIQRGFDNKKEEAIKILMKSVSQEVDNAVRKSKKLVLVK